MTRIKLLKIDELENGTQRYQSQLLVGKDKIMKCYGYENKGFDFYPYKKEYEIVSNKKDMILQKL